MSARYLVESTVDLIHDEIKSKIASALSEVKSLYNDHLVTLEVPQNYFIYPVAAGYRTPAVFIIADDVDFQKRTRGANHISATVSVNVSVLVEDKDRLRLTTKAFRYQDALHKILDQTRLTTPDGKLALTVLVTRASFSPLYSDTADANSPIAMFRKEVVLTLEVEHWENF